MIKKYVHWFVLASSLGFQGCALAQSYTPSGAEFYFQDDFEERTDEVVFDFFRGFFDSTVYTFEYLYLMNPDSINFKKGTEYNVEKDSNRLIIKFKGKLLYEYETRGKSVCKVP